MGMAKSSTVTQDVYQRLRGDLLSCRLIPGEKLRVDVLCQRMAAGSSAVREGLSRLTSEGLVTLEPLKGFRVTPLSSTELRDLTATRCHIEALCIRNAIAHADLEWEGGIVTALYRMAGTPIRMADDPARYSDAYGLANTLFHEAVVATCQSPALLGIRQMLYARQERYLWLSMPLAREARDVQAEHDVIGKAALAHDADATITAMNDHMNRTASIIFASCRADGDLLMPNTPRRRVA